MVVAIKLLTAEDLAALPDNGMQQELVQGVLIEMPPPSLWHGFDALHLGSLLRIHVQMQGLGMVVAGAGFTLHRNPDTVRAPDVAFISARRVPTNRGTLPYLEGAPDLAIEIVSPGNSRTEIAEKVADYLAAGSRLVWVLNARRREVAVHRPGQPPQVIGEDGTLSGEDVVPEFSVLVRTLLD